MALSLPGAALLTLAGGAVFGLLWGVVIVSFASSIGATLAFLISRFLLRDWVQQRFGQRLQAIDEGVKREGAFYLFTLRLVPVFPFFLVNLLSGLTGMKARTFYWVSQLGMLAGTVVYVNAGTQLAKIDSLSGILSPGLLGSFALLGVFPLLARKIVDIGAHEQGLRRVEEAATLRPQPGRHRRRQRRPGHFLHRRCRQGQGDAGREAPHGRRLPEHRLRALEGADPLGQAAVAHGTREGIRHRLGTRRVRFRRR
jgi:uncharacterized membrane protein YdjX (TVP38/TMEM64 family)